MSDTLSPSEFQSLFGGLDLSSQRTPSHARNPVEAADLSSQFTLPLSLAPADQARLHAWQTTFIRRWQQSWSDAFRKRFCVGESSIALTRLREFVDRHRAWKAFEVRVTQSDFVFWLAIDDQLVTDHLNLLLGAQSDDLSAVTARNWGPVEVQLTSRLVHTVCSSLLPAGHAFDSKAVDFSADWIAHAPVFLLTEVIQVELQLLCGQSVGSLRLGIPSKVAQAWFASDDDPGAEKLSIENPAGDNSIKLRATLGPIQITSAELRRLEIGDVILLGGGADPQCDVRLNLEHRFTAIIGSHQGLKAIQLANDRSPGV